MLKDAFMHLNAHKMEVFVLFQKKLLLEKQKKYSETTNPSQLKFASISIRIFLLIILHFFL